MVTDIAEILKYAPKDITLYTDMFGDVTLNEVIDDPDYPIIVNAADGTKKTYTARGFFSITTSKQCGIWPSSHTNIYNKYTWKNWQKYIFKQKPCEGAIVCRNNDIYDKWIIRENGIFCLSKKSREHGFGEFDFNSPALTDFKFINPKLGISTDNNIEINPKPGELVLVSLLQENDISSDLNKWQVAVFSHKEKWHGVTYYVANSRIWRNCLPFNKYTDHLIGTDEYDFIYTQNTNKK